MTELARFKVTKKALINGLQLSNIFEKALVAAVAHSEEGILGFSLTNASDNPDSDLQLYGSYALIIGQEIKDYHSSASPGSWPVFYISCEQRFINSVMSLPPLDDNYLKMVLYQTSDPTEKPDFIKSEAAIFGEHNSCISSIIRHSISSNIARSHLKFV